MNHTTTWTLTGDTECRFCGYEDHATVTLSAPPETPHAITCENCGRESAIFVPDYTITPSDPAADSITEQQDD